MAATSRIAIAVSVLGGAFIATPALAAHEIGDGTTTESNSSIDAQETAAQSEQATASNNDTGEPEIVVTAQRREERLSDVPISVTVLGGNTLQQNVIVSTNDLTVAVPGLNWGRSTNFSQPTIRGVGSRNASAGDEPNVATFVDGV